MPKDQGLGVDAFFSPVRRPQRISKAEPSPTRIRTTITLTQDEAEQLELLRLRLRRREGRGLTYSRVVGLALASLARAEELSPPPA